MKNLFNLPKEVIFAQNVYIPIKDHHQFQNFFINQTERVQDIFK